MSVVESRKVFHSALSFLKTLRSDLRLLQDLSPSPEPPDGVTGENPTSVFAFVSKNYIESFNWLGRTSIFVVLSYCRSHRRVLSLGASYCHIVLQSSFLKNFNIYIYHSNPLSSLQPVLKEYVKRWSFNILTKQRKSFSLQNKWPPLKC